MSGSTKDYRFGPKNNWRRWVWNQVLRRTDGQEKTGTILYLAGPQDLDRAIAVDKGVPTQNMIAIDRCEDNVKAVRSADNYAVHADALAVIRAWPEHSPVAAVVLDLCSGLWSMEKNALLLSALMLNSALSKSILAVNLQRGRDAAANEWMAIASQRALAIRHRRIHPLHRGFAFAYQMVSGGCVLTGSRQLNFDRDCMDAMEFLDPEFFSYHSGDLVFDSVVMNAIGSRWVCDDDAAFNTLRSEVDHLYQKDKRVVRRIAATLATRTRQNREAVS